MSRVLCVRCLFVALLCCVGPLGVCDDLCGQPSEAQTSGENASRGGGSATAHRFRISAHYWSPVEISSRFYSDEHHAGEEPAVPFRFQDIGLENSIATGFRGEASARITSKNEIQTSYSSSEHTGSGNAKREFTYDGQRAFRGDPVDSRFTLTQIGIGYLRTISIGARHEFALGVGFTRTHYDTKLTYAPGKTASTESIFAYFLPVGVQWALTLGSRWSMRSSLWISVVGGKGHASGTYWDQVYIDSTLQFAWNVSQRISFDLGLSYAQLTLRSREHQEIGKDSELDYFHLRQIGPTLGISFSF